jgi:hypothetical protein
MVDLLDLDVQAAGTLGQLAVAGVAALLKRQVQGLRPELGRRVQVAGLAIDDETGQSTLVHHSLRRI